MSAGTEAGPTNRRYAGTEASATTRGGDRAPQPYDQK